MDDSRGYEVHYYVDGRGKVPVKAYIDGVTEKEQAKIFTYIELLRKMGGYLDEPYAKHITGKIRELRVDFSRSRHRIFYFIFIGRKIILLHAFLKKTPKTPQKEMNRALENYQDVLIHKQKYE